MGGILPAFKDKSFSFFQELDFRYASILPFFAKKRISESQFIKAVGATQVNFLIARGE
jgi:hypothetical protein